MDSNIRIDQLSMSFDWDDDSSTESDSGISSISSDSISSQFDYQDHSFISTVSSIARDISVQSSIYLKALIDFTIAGLTSDDVYIRRSAAVFLWQLFRACNMPCYDSVETKEKMTLLLKVSDSIVESLETALKTDSYSSQMLYWVSGCFHYISRNPIGCDQLLKGNLVLLVSMLGCDLQAVVYYSITAIHNILLNCQYPFTGTHLVRCVTHILNRITMANDNLGDTQIKLMAICIDCLSNLAYHNNVVKAQISSHSTATEVILSTLLRNINNEKFLFLGMRLLKILSTIQDSKKTISNSVVFPELLTLMLKSKLKLNSQIWSIAFWTLRNLSDILFQGHHRDSYHDVLIQICDKFQQINRLDNDLILQCAAGILANASCDCPRNKSLLVKMKVHYSILQTLSVSKDKFQKWSGETLEAMYRCLHHLCSNHDSATMVIEKCLNSDVVFLSNFDEITLTGTTRDDRSAVGEEVPISWSILRAWLGLVRHLCIHDSKRYQQRSTQSNHKHFIDRITVHLRQFRSQIENYISMSSNEPEISSAQYLKQLHSSIINIININDSPERSIC